MLKKINRLNPSFACGRYHILSLLKRNLKGVVEQYIAPMNGNSILLDYGCGSAPYEGLFLKYIKTYLKADIKPDAKGENFVKVQSDSSKIELPENSVDIVFSTQVLEHVNDPENYLKEAWRVTREDGLLVLSTHGRWMYHPDPQDFWRWTKDGLVRTIEKGGWHVEELRPVMGLAATGVQFFQDGISQRLVHFIKPLFFVFMAFLQIIAERMDCKKDDASVYIIVARKLKELKHKKP
jgi:SAM-dependent methyltransferase